MSGIQVVNYFFESGCTISIVATFASPRDRDVALTFDLANINTSLLSRQPATKGVFNTI